MSLLSTLVTDASIADEKDSVGSSILESGIYEAKVAMAYITKSEGGALGLVVNLKTSDNREIRETFWMTSGTAKGSKNYYEKDGKKNYLPGFLHANALALLTVGQEISALETESKAIAVYSPELKKEVPTKVDVVMDLLGKDIVVGVIKQKVDKTKKNPSSGIYEPTGETREENEIDKLFRAKDHMTTAEIRAQAETAAFVKTWETKWAGKTKDKTKGAAGSAGMPGNSAANSAAVNRPKSSLFA